MPRVVVTGGAGFVGSHVAIHFSEKGHDVVVCDNLSRAGALGQIATDALHNWNYLKDKFPRIKLQKMDLRDLKAVKEVSQGADIIIHAAGQVAVTKSLTNPRDDFEINTVGTFNILEAARSNDSTLAFCSTNKVYGENVNAIPLVEQATRYAFKDQTYLNGVPENFPIDHTTHTPYGSSKLAADIYVQDYSYTYGLHTGVFRMSCIYGERQFGVEDQGWLAWFVIATLTDRPITIYGDGKQVRDVLCVQDLVDVFDRFVQGDQGSTVLNIGGGPANTLSLLELLSLLRSLTGRVPRVSKGSWRPADQKVYISDVGKAQRALGWKPVISPVDGISRIIRWVTNNMNLFR